MRDEVPEGWKRAQLGRVFKEQKTRCGDRNGLRALSLTKSEGLILAKERFGRTLHSKDTSKYRIVERDDIVLDPMLLWDGAIARLWRFPEGFVSPDYRVYSPTGSATPRFLEYLVQGGWMRRAFKNNARGTNKRRNRVSRADFLRIVFPLPPLPEQRKIAAILSSVDDAIAASRAVIEQTRHVKKGLLQELLTEGIGHARFKKSPLGENPVGWRLGTPGQLSKFAGGHGFRPADWAERGLPIIRIQNLNGSGDFNLYDGPVKEKWLVKPGQLLFAWAGSAGSSFGPCLWPGPLGVLNQHIYKIKPAPDVNKVWLFEVLNLITTRIESRGRGFKRSLLHVHKSDITDQIIPIPPKEEQDQIAERVAGIDSSVELQSRTLASLQKAKAGLLQDLLTGKVRVTP